MLLKSNQTRGKNMKKFNLITLAMISCLIPCFLLIGCTSKEEFLITSSCSSAMLGSITGGDNYRSKAEGTNITLKAIPKDNCEFVSWIKDYEEVISGNSNDPTSLTLVYGADTQGHYTALFKDRANPQKVSYAKVVKLQLNESINEIEIDWSRTDINQTHNAPAISLQKPTRLANVQTDMIFYLGELGKDLTYRFSGTITKVEGKTTNYYPITFTSTLSKSLFDSSENGLTCTIKGSYGQSKEIELIFEKL